MSEEKQGYDRNKDVIIAKFFSKTEKRYINVLAYNYDNKGAKIRIVPASKNTNPNAEPNKMWIQQKGISGISKQEAIALVEALEKAISKI